MRLLQTNLHCSPKRPPVFTFHDFACERVRQAGAAKIPCTTALSTREAKGGFNLCVHDVADERKGGHQVSCRMVLLEPGLTARPYGRAARTGSEGRCSPKLRRERITTQFPALAWRPFAERKNNNNNTECVNVPGDRPTPWAPQCVNRAGDRPTRRPEWGTRVATW
jgi:hypothetical protein